jgi:uncharacterized protein (TIGR02001 family)
MKKLALSLIAMAVAAPALATAGDVSYNVGVTSDYVWRGMSQTDSKPALQAGVDATAGLWYFGGWASNVDKDTLGSNLEYDLYAGIKPVAGPVTFDIGVISYNYQNLADYLDAGTTEFKVGASFVPAYDWTVGATYYTNTGDAGVDYYELTAGGPLGKLAVGPFKLGASASYGSYTDDGYANWKAGVNGTTENGWGVELAYTDTDIKKAEVSTGYYDITKGRAVLSVKKTF